MRTKVNSKTVSVNSVNSVVNCTVETEIDLTKIKAYQVVKDTAGWKTFLKRWQHTVDDNDWVKIVSVGSASCNLDEGETFNERYGRELAELRAQNESLIAVGELYREIERLCVNELMYHDIALLVDNVKRCRRNVKRYIKEKLNA